MRGTVSSRPKINKDLLHIIIFSFTFLFLGKVATYYLSTKTKELCIAPYRIATSTDSEQRERERWVGAVEISHRKILSRSWLRAINICSVYTVAIDFDLVSISVLNALAGIK